MEVSCGMSQLTDPFSKSYNSNRYWNKGTKGGGEVSEHIGYLHIRILIRSLNHYTTLSFHVSTHTTPHTGYTYTMIHYYKVTHWESEKKSPYSFGFYTLFLEWSYYQSQFMNSPSWNTKNCRTYLKQSNWLWL